MNFLIIISFFLPIINSSIISESSITKCEQRSENDSSVLNGTNELYSCKNKIIVTLTLENHQISGAESINVNLRSFINKTDNTTWILKQPIQITLEKSQVYAIYPLIYKQDFNYQPEEKIILSTSLGCEDDWHASDATCGFQYDSNNQKVMNSQGLCCRCSLADSLGLDNDDYSRVAGACGFLNFGTGSATAHCLNFGELWYSAYQIEQYSIYYEINANFEDQEVIEELVVGSFKSVASSEDGKVIIRVIGDFMPSQLPSELSNYYMMRPIRPTTHAYYLEGKGKWVFIEKELVTLDATVCNKIGVGYTAFKNQNNPCENPIGSCLLNQLAQYIDSDLERLKNGNDPEYSYYIQSNPRETELQLQEMIKQN